MEGPVHGVYGTEHRKQLFLRPTEVVFCSRFRTQAEMQSPSRSGAALGDAHLRALRWCLQISIVAMCLAEAWRALFYGDVVFSFLFLDADWPEEDALRVTHAAAYGLVAAAALSWWRVCWPALLTVSVWMAVLAALSVVQQPPRAELIPGARAARVLGPVGLALLLAFPREGAVPWSRERAAIGLLQLAASSTFICHGLMALAHEGEFLDYIFMAGQRLLGLEISQAVAERALSAIGIIDLVMGAALLLAPGRARMGAAAYMALWGLLTASARIVHSGFDNSFESLLRVPNWAVPLGLFLYWFLSRGSETAELKRSPDLGR